MHTIDVATHTRHAAAFCHENGLWRIAALLWQHVATSIVRVANYAHLSIITTISISISIKLVLLLLVVVVGVVVVVVVVLS